MTHSFVLARHGHEGQSGLKRGITVIAEGVAMNTMHVSILGLPEATLSTVAGLGDAFNIFHLVRGMDDALPDVPPFLAEVLDVADGDAPRCALQMRRHIRDVDSTDILIVPSLAVDPFSWKPGGHRHVVEWIRRMHANGVRVCSACSGALLLAETGLLDGTEATTHWAFEQTFRRHFPHINLRLEKLLVQTGPDGDIVMSGAAGSWHDLALYLIAYNVGPAAAQFVARFLLLEWHTDGQKAYSVFRPARNHGDAMIAAAQDWLDHHLSAPKPVETMTEKSGLATRTFNRRFAHANGLAPIHYVHHLRIEAAKRRLERSTASVEQIAWQVGYEDPAFFRRLFKRITDVSPSAYRRKLQLPAYAEKTAADRSRRRLSSRNPSRE